MHVEVKGGRTSVDFGLGKRKRKVHGTSKACQSATPGSPRGRMRLREVGTDVQPSWTTPIVAFGECSLLLTSLLPHTTACAKVPTQTESRRTATYAVVRRKGRVEARRAVLQRRPGQVLHGGGGQGRQVGQDGGVDGGGLVGGGVGQAVGEHLRAGGAGTRALVSVCRALCEGRV